MTRLFREYIKQNPDLWNDELKKRIYDIAETMVDLEGGIKFIELAFGVTAMKRRPNRTSSLTSAILQTVV